MVQSAEYNTLYYPNLSQSYKIINAMGAWNAAGGRATAGAGIKIGDIDSGIEETHPFFDPTDFSYPQGFPKCDAEDSNSHHPDQDCKYVTPKVIVAKVFFNKAQQQGLDAHAVEGHGTHTAGIAAGVTGKTAVVNGVNINDMSGIAPGAWLGNYNVFPDSVNESRHGARSEDILNAVDAAVEDGMDVLNLSLGGGYHGNNDLLAIGLDNAVDAGVVVAVAAGNSGPGAGTLESPGRARKVITVGASTNQHFVGQPLTYPVGGRTRSALRLVTSMRCLRPSLICSTPNRTVAPASIRALPVNSRSSTAGRAPLARKSPTRKPQVQSPLSSSTTSLEILPQWRGRQASMMTIPAVMIGKNEGVALRASGATTVSAVATFQEFITEANKDILAGFSSQGPTNVDFAAKPDLTSVGVNVLSSCVSTDPVDCGEAPWAFLSGTSMSTPHIAGSAAVLLQLHDDWTPAQIKSALVNRADLVVKDAATGLHDVGPTAQGAGRENLSVAADATTWMDPASASFGRVTLGHPTSVTITLSNPTGTAETFSVSVTKFTPDTFGGTVPSIYDAGTLSAGDARISVPGSVNVPANGSAVLTVTVNNGIPSGEVVQGWINLDGPGSNDLHFAYYAIVGH